jgi:hypothetical protein
LQEKRKHQCSNCFFNRTKQTNLFGRRMYASRPQCITRIDTRLENFLAKQLGFENIEFYEQESCVEELVKSANFLKKYPFRILIVCRDRIYITDNPPKNLDNFICYEDILEIKAVND